MIINDKCRSFKNDQCQRRWRRIIKKIFVFLENNPEYTITEICNDQQMMCSLGIHPDVSRNIYQAKDQALRLEEELVNHDIGLWWLGDEDYPHRLKKMRESKLITIPSVLFYKGNTELLNQKSIGFTGSRKVSESGIRITAAAVSQLVKSEIAIVSGYAKGVDLTAHTTALEEEGNPYFIQRGGIPIRGDKNGVPVLRKIYSALKEKEQEEEYQQISLPSMTDDAQFPESISEKKI